MKILMMRCAAILVILLSVSCSMAQPSKTNYEERWKKVDALVREKGLTRSALTEVENIYALAKKEKNDAQALKALVYIADLSADLEEDGETGSLKTLEKELLTAKAPESNLLHSLIAQKYLLYFRENRWELYNRTSTTGFAKDDIRTWGLEDFHHIIGRHFLQSLESADLLKKTKLEPYEPVIRKGNARPLRPTLYDLLSHHALDYFSDEEREITKPANTFTVRDTRAFADIKTFTAATFQTSDTVSLHYRALLLYQDILRFHLGDPDPSALLDADLERLAFMHQVSVLPEKDKLYRDALLDIGQRYPDQAYGGLASFLAIEQDYHETLDFAPDDAHTATRFALVSISERLSAIEKKYPNASAAARSRNLLNTIQSPSLQFQTEIVVVPGKSFLALVSFRNIKTLHYRIIPLDEDTRNSMNYGNEKFWSKASQLKALRSETVPLPDPGDLRDHRVEIPLESLPVGQYLVLVSADESFSNKKNNPMAALELHASNISYIGKEEDFFVVHRETGQPLSGAAIQVWQQQYDYQKSRYVPIKKELLKADANGFFRYASVSNVMMEFSWQNDHLFTGRQQYQYYPKNQQDNNKNEDRILLFTDRSIYRPGQTVYFKAIMLRRDGNGKHNVVLPDSPCTLYFQDANREIIDSLRLTTNAFGSVHGQFRIPEGRMTGEYGIFTADNRYAVQFSVEEYKRPSFELAFDPVKAAYRLRDTVTITGKVVAYSGNHLNDASVKYRVVRRTRFPWPWRFGGLDMQNTGETEIANGTSTSDDQGRFQFSFQAIPDESTNPKFDPVFDYGISAEATDPGGETRSGETSVSIGYKALNLQIGLENERTPANSFTGINISATNFAGESQSLTGTVSIYSIQYPDRLIKPRYWPRPDTSIISRDKFIRDFPHDEYMDELDKSKWKTLQTVFSKTDSIITGRPFPLGKTILAPGWYAIEVTAKDQNGEVVTDRKYAQVFDPANSIEGQPEYVWEDTHALTAEPGQTISLRIGSSADSLWVIRQVDKSGTGAQPRPLTENGKKKTGGHATQNPSGPYDIIRINRQVSSLLVPVTEDDRGGFGVLHVFVKHNRVFQSTQAINVPWTNKDLQVNVKSYRDKTLPGTKETWTLQISGDKGEKVNAEILTSLYDASLDQFRVHTWNRPGLFSSYSTRTWDAERNFEGKSSLNKYILPDQINLPAKTYDQFIWQVSNNILVRRKGMMMNVAAAPMADERIAADSVSAPPSSADQILQGKLAGLAVTPGTSPEAPAVTTRKNFSETAFFYPDLRTDENGGVSISFTIPEALTRWKWQSFAHTKDMSTGMATRNILTQKELMIQPQMPRFLREGDRISLSARVSNLSDKELTGQAQLQLIDPETEEPVDGLFKNIFPSQYFTVPAGQNTAVHFDIEVPYNYNKPLRYRVIAQSGERSDGEENMIPVLSNRMLVTESLPIVMRGNGTQVFHFDKLEKAASASTLTHHRFSIEYSTNPAWYAVLALPYLMEFPYECAEQLFSRYYANSLAAFVANHSPKIKSVFEQWRTKDTVALISSLLKNPELKSVILEQTPWVLEAKDETEQRRNIALLFDLTRLSNEQAKSLARLADMQSPNGGFVWFKGGPDDRYITQYIISGIGHLRLLKAIPERDRNELQNMTNKALIYLDKKIREDYDQLIKQKTDLKKYTVNAYELQYLYMRSFFPEIPVSANTRAAVDYFTAQAKKSWSLFSRFGQGLTALAAWRSGDKATATIIMKSLEENAIRSPQLGMYWKDNTRGYFWYQSPIETHALLLEAFDEITNKADLVEELRLWLLCQKQVQDWGTTKATAEAVYALLRRGKDFLAENPSVTITAGTERWSSKTENAEAGTGHFQVNVPGKSVTPSMGKIEVKQEGKSAAAISWGAAHWQYFEDIDKITPAATPLQLRKQFFIRRNSDKGPVLDAVKDGQSIHVGDHLTVRIELRSDRDMEYIHMKDLRAAGTEPLNVLSQYKWQGGLGYYEATRDASTDFFFSWLPKGTWVFEYDLYVTHNGNFSAGITSIQSMYAPEFNAHSKGERLVSGE